MNQIQVIGSHNSYHREVSDAEKKIQAGQNPGAVDLWYSHASTRSAARGPERPPAGARPVPGPERRALHVPVDPQDRRSAAGAHRPGARQARHQGDAHRRRRLQHRLPQLRPVPAAGEDLVRRAPARRADRDQPRAEAVRPGDRRPGRGEGSAVGRRQPEQRRRRDPLGLQRAAAALAGRRPQAGSDAGAVGHHQGLADAEERRRQGAVLLRQRRRRRDSRPVPRGQAEPGGPGGLHSGSRG